MLRTKLCFRPETFLRCQLRSHNKSGSWLVQPFKFLYFDSMSRCLCDEARGFLGDGFSCSPAAPCTHNPAVCDPNSGIILENPQCFHFKQRTGCLDITHRFHFNQRTGWRDNPKFLHFKHKTGCQVWIYWTHLTQYK